MQARSTTKLSVDISFAVIRADADNKFFKISAFGIVEWFSIISKSFWNT